MQHQELSELKLKLKISEEQMSTAAMETEELKRKHLAEIKNLNQAIENFDIESKRLVQSNECQQNVAPLTNENISLINQEAVDFKAEIKNLTKNKETLDLRLNDLMSEIEQMRGDLEKAKSENMSLADDNIDLATEIEKVRTEYLASEEVKQEEINSLQLEIKRLNATISENANRYEELQRMFNAMPKDTRTNEYVKLEADLKIALSDLESKILECEQAKEREKQMTNDIKILSAKLTKHRETSLRKEGEWEIEKASLMESADRKIKENRLELEGKLEKMKAKMVSFFRRLFT